MWQWHQLLVVLKVSSTRSRRLRYWFLVNIDNSEYRLTTYRYQHEFMVRTFRYIQGNRPNVDGKSDWIWRRIHCFVFLLFYLVSSLSKLMLHLDKTFYTPICWPSFAVSNLWTKSVAPLGSWLAETDKNRWNQAHENKQDVRRSAMRIWRKNHLLQGRVVNQWCLIGDRLWLITNAQGTCVAVSLRLTFGWQIRKMSMEITSSRYNWCAHF